MATSGTIGKTRINTAKFIEKAVWRCGVLPSAITPEILSSCKEDLIMLLTGLSNRGLNLWCVDNKLIPVNVGRPIYKLPVGTTDILNLSCCIPSRPEYTVSGDTTSSTDPLAIVRVGVKFSESPSSFSLEYYDDSSSSWVVAKVFSEVEEVGSYNWGDLPRKISSTGFRVSSNVAYSVSDIYLATSVMELPVTPFNRDDYSAQPDKWKTSETFVNYWFEKILEPQVTLWPVPSNDFRHMHLFRYRQVQDVGALTEELELPTRWYEAISWHLAARVSFILPGVDKERRSEVAQMAGTMTIEVEGAESDNSPVFFTPRIGVYTV